MIFIFDKLGFDGSVSFIVEKKNRTFNWWILYIIRQRCLVLNQEIYLRCIELFKDSSRLNMTIFHGDKTFYHGICSMVSIINIPTSILSFFEIFSGIVFFCFYGGHRKFDSEHIFVVFICHIFFDLFRHEHSCTNFFYSFLVNYSEHMEYRNLNINAAFKQSLFCDLIFLLNFRTKNLYIFYNSSSVDY